MRSTPARAQRCGGKQPSAPRRAACGPPRRWPRTSAELKLEAQNAAANPAWSRRCGGTPTPRRSQDLFRTEEWWEPYRNAFKVYAVAFEGDKLDVLEGMKPADFASDLLIREARERKESSPRS